MGSVSTMVASWVGPLAPTSSPIETRRAVTTPSIGGGIVERRFGGDLPARELDLPLVLRFRLLQGCLGAGLGGLRLLELQFVGFRLDGEERRTLLHLVAVFVVDLLQEPLHPRDQIGGIDRGGIAGRFQITRDRLPHRNRDGDLRRRRRHIAIVLPAAREHRGERDCGKTRTPHAVALLRARGQRPCGCRAAEQRDESAPLHSITSSARASSVGGTSRPSALAVLRLITNSYLVGACTGRSAGFSPLRMRST